MKNYLQNGHVTPRVTTPAGDIASGNALIVGTPSSASPLFPWQEGDPVELSTTGVFQPPKASAAVLGVFGARVAVGTTRRRKVNPPSRPRGRFFPIGVAVEAAGERHHKSVAVAARRRRAAAREASALGSLIADCQSRNGIKWQCGSIQTVGM